MPADGVAEVQNHRVAHLVTHGRAAAPGGHHARQTQHPQMFGRVRLLEPAGAVDLSHAERARPQALQDAQARGVAEDREEPGKFGVGDGRWHGADSFIAVR